MAKPKNDDLYEAYVYTWMGFELDSKPSKAFIGFLWIFTILTFPIWIWIFIGYYFLYFIGEQCNGVKVKKVIKSKAKEQEFYY